MPIAGAALEYFALVFGAGFVLGVVRVLLVAPLLGARSAELLEMPLMFAIIVLAARRVVSRYRVITAAPAAAVGAAAVAVLLGAELMLATTLQDRSFSEYLATRDPVAGGVYLLMLALFAAMPWLIVRRRAARVSGP